MIDINLRVCVLRTWANSPEGRGSKGLERLSVYFFKRLSINVREPNFANTLQLQSGLTLSSDGILGPLSSDLPAEGLDLSDIPPAIESWLRFVEPLSLSAKSYWDLQRLLKFYSDHGNVTKLVIVFFFFFNKKSLTNFTWLGIIPGCLDIVQKLSSLVCKSSQGK